MVPPLILQGSPLSVLFAMPLATKAFTAGVSFVHNVVSLTM